MIHHSRECISTAPESNGGELYTTPANLGQMIFYALQHSAVPSVEVVWPNTSRRAVVAARCFHFTITALTGDWAALAWQIFDQLVGKVASYGGATFKVTELFGKANLLPMYILDWMVVC
jgi:hypothetical protein